MFDRARRGPIDVVVVDPSTNADVTVAMHGDMVGEVVRWMMYSPRSARSVPALLRRAAAGDWRPLAEEAIRQRRSIMTPNSMGLYLSVTCAEDLPGSDADVATRLAEGTYLGDYRYRQQRAACDQWIAGAVTEDFHTDVVSDVPALLVSGALDPVTPPESGEAVAARLKNSLHVVLPFGAHGDGRPAGQRLPRADAARVRGTRNRRGSGYRLRCSDTAAGVRAMSRYTQSHAL